MLQVNPQTERHENGEYHIDIKLQARSCNQELKHVRSRRDLTLHLQSLISLGNRLNNISIAHQAISCNERQSPRSRNLSVSAESNKI